MSQEYTPVEWIDETPTTEGTTINKARLDQMQTAHHYADGFEEVDAVPTESPGVEYHKVVYCTADSTIYRWNGTQWTKDIDDSTKALLDAEIARAEGAEQALQTAVAAKYTKPASGIPGTDLAASVQASLAKADTAVQPAEAASTYLSKTEAASTYETQADAAGKAPTDHSSTATTYGAGSATKYGHVKVDNAMADNSTNPVENGVIKAFVNSSISTNTANFLGTFDAITDLGLSPGATHEQVAAAIAGEVSAPTNNDYVFVSWPASGSSPGSYDRYKFNGSAWGYEYTLNNSSFTQAQWDAINSGLTAADKTALQNMHADIVSASVTFALQGTPDDASFPYRAEISNAAITGATFASVVYSAAQTMTGNYAPYCETASGKLYLYANTAVGTITVPTIHLDN